MSRPPIDPSSSAPLSPLHAIACELRRAKVVLLLTHEHPDGDGIGSLLALRLALQALGSHPVGVLLQPCPTKYRFLPDADQLLTDLPAHPFDCAVDLDCDGEARLGALLPAFRACPVTISIDHHLAECDFADTNWCDGTAAATGLLIHLLLSYLGVSITPDIATCLYTAIATDTGFFRFQNTSPQALRACADLVAAGADPAYIARQASEAIALPKALLLGRAFASLQLCDDLLAAAVLTLEDYQAAHALPEHTDGIIDELKRLDGPPIIALLREETPGTWRVSLRSQGPDVAAICRQFGGGGHRLAAGCEIKGDRAAVLNSLQTAISAIIGRQRP
jgi:phosphoesterase RecJ-like protein